MKIIGICNNKGGVGKKTMPKSFLQNAGDRSGFLVPAETDDGQGKQGERAATSPLRSASLIDINRIKPDPNQPRKTFNQETLESLAESIKELGGIIDPLSVEFEESEDIFRIINGERRYRATKIAGFDELPCIVKEVNERERYRFGHGLCRVIITGICPPSRITQPYTLGIRI